MAATLGVVAAGVVLFEAALIPGVAIGAVAVLAPRYLPRLGRRLRPLLKATVGEQAAPTAASPPGPALMAPLAALPRFKIGQALAKTITFRIIVTTLDFTTNYLVLGEFATAAGLSAFALAVGPVFYLVHETAWNYLVPPVAGNVGPWGAAVVLPIFSTDGRRGFTISRPLAKTITFRTIATAMEFTATYVVVGDVATAAALSAFGFVLGPFVYLGHEMAWAHFASPGQHVLEPPPPTKLLQAPA